VIRLIVLALSLSLLPAVALAEPAPAEPERIAARGKKRGKAAAEPTAEERRAAVLRLIEASGGLEAAKVSVDGMLQQMRTLLPQVPPAFWGEFRDRIDWQDFANALAPVYEKHFTHDEVLAIVAWHESEVGQKQAKLSATMTQESMAIGEQWGRKLAEQIVSEAEAYQTTQ
jgi:hypothetical protein